MYSTGFLGRGLQQKMECEDDNAKSCYEYGKLMIDAKAGPVSKIRAGESLGHACTMGLNDSCVALAGMVRSGDGLAQLKNECTDGGNKVVCYVTGWVYAKGLGVSPNVPLATPYFEKSCSDGFAPGCNAAEQLKALEQRFGVQPQSR